jgi:hypothetical protein
VTDVGESIRPFFMYLLFKNNDMWINNNNHTTSHYFREQAPNRKTSYGSFLVI